MKLYHVKSGVIAGHEGKYYHVADDWTAFINDDLVLEKTRALLKTAAVVEAPADTDWLPVIGEGQELWACGVTYYRSMQGRQEESKSSGGADFYAKVYEAERPECFFKSNPFRVAAHRGRVRIRKDSSWDVPEPELTLVVTSSGTIIGYTIGNDMSSRSIEGENPLYLPQAKTYDGCASLGPCVYLAAEVLSPDTQISMQILRDSDTVFSGSIPLSQMKRKPEELVGYVYRESSFPAGCLIMTGTGIVPGSDFTLQGGDEIRITIDPMGTLINWVE